MHMGTRRQGQGTLVPPGNVNYKLVSVQGG